MFGERLLDRPDPSVLVHGGSSGIGVATIQLCTALGVRVHATAGSDAKCRACEDLGAGAERCFNYTTEDWAGEMLSGVDVVLDMVCAAYLQSNLEVLHTGGLIAIIDSHGGVTPGPEVDLRQLMRRRLMVGGSTIRPRSTSTKAMIVRELHQTVWPLLESGKVTVVTDSVFPLARADDAHRRMESSEHIGKVLLRVR